MFVSVNFNEGERAHNYRSLSQIRSDIRDVSEKIRDINEGLNVRHILMQTMSRSAEEDPKKWIPELAEIISGAEAGLEALKELHEVLDELNEELEYTLCEIT
ncbi:MAG: hypothetical protein IIX96_01490 [Clostridia bacterium]|nr:hypothetical protein [Clostridia bacterium]